MEWKAFLFVFARTILLGLEVLTTNVANLVETVAAKAARILKYSVANGTIIFAICQSAFGCPEARAIVTAFQMADDGGGSAFALFTLLEERFTMKKLQTLQKLLVELNSLICSVMETPAKLLDRFNKIVLGIRAIDAAQLPTELQLITILKNAIADKYKLLNVMLLAMTNLTLIQLKEKFLNWESKFDLATSEDSAGPRQVANFAGSGFGNQKKKAFVKKLKSGRPIFTCWNCDQEGHMKRDCPQPDNSESSERKRGGGSGNDYSGGDGGNKFKTARSDQFAGNSFSRKNSSPNQF
jgi:hypothetical protein